MAETLVSLVRSLNDVRNRRLDAGDADRIREVLADAKHRAADWGAELCSFEKLIEDAEAAFLAPADQCASCCAAPTATTVEVSHDAPRDFERQWAEFFEDWKRRQSHRV